MRAASRTRNHWGVAAALALIIACAPTPAPGVVYVDRGPPADRAEVIVARPGPDFVWVRGHWRWYGGDYDWVPGHWAPLERGYRDWVPGHWAHYRLGWYYVEGHWA